MPQAAASVKPAYLVFLYEKRENTYLDFAVGMSITSDIDNIGGQILSSDVWCFHKTRIPQEASFISFTVILFVERIPRTQRSYKDIDKHNWKIYNERERSFLLRYTNCNFIYTIEESIKGLGRR